MKPSLLLPLLALLVLTATALADSRGDTPGTPPSTPQEQLAKFHVPPGFEVQLVAAEPEIQKPINLNFDAAGRLWVSGSEMYPWPASTDVNGQPIPGFEQGWRGIVEGFRVGDAPQPSAAARDSVRVLSDFDATGRARKVRVFADKLNIPSGIQPIPRGSKAVAAVYDRRTSAEEKSATVTDRRYNEPKGDSAIVYSIPNIWLMTDVDGDGFAEKREPLYTGFGYTDTHGGASSFIYWIDGWIYGTHGFRNHSEVTDRAGRVTVLDSGNTYRFRPDGSAFEIYTHGQTNPFGLAFDPLGNLFSADSHSKPVYMLLRGGYYEGIGKQHDGLGFAPRITDDDHGSSAIAGIAFYADDKWPEEYRGNLFNGNPVTQRLNRDRLEWHGSTPKAIRMPDFLTCDDPWFRPVNLKLGPDGALYIADFYNPIIGHYEVPLTHPARDHEHGRIWRVVWRGTDAARETPGSTRVPRVGEGVPPSRTSPGGAYEVTPSPPGAPLEVRRGETPRPTRETRVLPGVAPDLTTVDAPALIEKLADPSLEVRRLATNELVDRFADRAFELLSRAVPTGVLFPSTWVDRDFHPLGASSGEKFCGTLAAASGLCALHRLKPLHENDAEMYAGEGGPIGIFETKMQAENPNLPAPPATFWDLMTNRITDPLQRRAIAETMAVHPAPDQIPVILRLMNEAAQSDFSLIHAARIALRNNLVSPESWSEAEKLSKKNSKAAARFAEISLGIPNPDAATFLLTHLQRTKLETPRAGEYLKHALLYLPAEKLGTVAKLLELVANAPLPRRLTLATNLAEAAKQRGGAIPHELTAWSQGVLLETLASNNDELTKPAIAAVRDLKVEAKLAPLARIARDEFRDGALRQAALEAAANLPASRELLVEAFAHPQPMNLRKRAAELLAQNGDTATVIAALPQAPWELALVISAALARTDAGATALLDAIEAGKAPARALTSKALVAGFFARPKPLQDRAKALAKDLPPEDARLERVIAERATAFLKSKPDAQHGAQVFQQQCAVCHRFRNAGGNVGPNLDGVAARGSQRLLEDILDPSRNVDPSFRQTIVETADGRTMTGTNPRDSADSLALTDATGTELLIPKPMIKTRTTLNVSIMPPLFETQLAPGELSDLMGYLLAPQ